MPRYFLDISYDGTSYHGWQRQPNALTVQQEVEDALRMLLRRQTTVMGAGRTDTGVHARQLVAHVDVDNGLDLEARENLIHRLNRYLPAAIAVNGIAPVTAGAHARFDATQRSYAYRISTGKDPFTAHTAFMVEQDLDFDKMNAAAKLLLGRQDFQCFSKSNTDVNTYLCEVREAFWKQEGTQWIFRVSADRFLRNMVRAIVGTLVEVGKDKWDLQDIERILKSRDRTAAGPSVPAHGLYLTQVKYPKNIYL